MEREETESEKEREVNEAEREVRGHLVSRGTDQRPTTTRCY